MEKKKKSYTQALSELESIIDKIENQHPDIDELSHLVKKAVELVNYCRNRLRATEDELNKTLGEIE